MASSRHQWSFHGRLIVFLYLVTQGGDWGGIVCLHDDFVCCRSSNYFRLRTAWLWNMAENMTRRGTQICHCEFHPLFVSNDTQEKFQWLPPISLKGTIVVPRVLSYPLDRERERGSGTFTMVREARQRLPCRTKHPTSDSRLFVGRQSRRAARLDLRKTAQLDRQLSLGR